MNVGRPATTEYPAAEKMTLKRQRSLSKTTGIRPGTVSRQQAQDTVREPPISV